MPRPAAPLDEFGPYVRADRQVWAELSSSLPVELSEETLRRVRSRLDTIDLQTVSEVYLPLTELINHYVENTGRLYASTHDFLRLGVGRTPFVIGVAGSVAVGKSTTSRLLRELLTQLPGRPRVEMVTTDGFLHPNAELERRQIMDRKGFPESYDRNALLRFVMDVKSGVPEASVPVYSHLRYDIDPARSTVVRQPDILIVEGLNVLQPARRRPDGSMALAVSDFFDFTVYVDAAADDLRAWYLQRFMRLRETAFRDPRSYFTRYAALDEPEARAYAERIWDTINGPNLEQNILPTRGRATVILRKDADHDIDWIRIRKV
ncbi:type I pantothenate kinase [Propioniciclava soli]|uniref:type I pantothenate kinase n=1 Tax=Propioniciclava soli TaxID=2775081 RepID=UPI001E5192B5|nr:type I pantothenate kinase [Propioniciclava soli]